MPQDDDIRRRREGLGLSRQQLASDADCSLTTLQMLETGYRPERSAALARVLDVLTGHEEASDHNPADADATHRQGDLAA